MATESERVSSCWAIMKVHHGGAARRFIPENPKIPEVPEIPELPDIPEVPEMPENLEIRVISRLGHRFYIEFSSFCEGTSRERLDSQFDRPNLRFCWQAQHFQGFADFADKAKIANFRRTLTAMQLRARAPREKIDFFAPGHDLASILVASARSPVLLGAFSGVSKRLWRLSGCSWDPPGRSRDAS